MSPDHDRRRNRRYSLQLKVRWRLTRSKSVLDQGIGRTLDISSGGLLFQTSRPLPVGRKLELAVDWPRLSHNTTPLQLVAFGTIVRSSEKGTAVRYPSMSFEPGAAPWITRKICRLNLLPGGRDCHKSDGAMWRFRRGLDELFDRGKDRINVKWDYRKLTFAGTSDLPGCVTRPAEVLRVYRHLHVQRASSSRPISDDIVLTGVRRAAHQSSVADSRSLYLGDGSKLAEQRALIADTARYTIDLSRADAGMLASRLGHGSMKAMAFLFVSTLLAAQPRI